MSDDVRWILLYTRRQAEEWAAVNLRRQGFETVLPMVRSRGQLSPLFPRYLFAGLPEGDSARAMQHTFGVQYTVMCGMEPARVTAGIIAEIRARMNTHGVVTLDGAEPADPLFAARQRDRLLVLERLAAAGFRVRAA